MVRFVEPPWLERALAGPSVLPVDPRRPMRYLQGHVRTAINVPVAHAFDADGRLLPNDQLARWLGNSGIQHETALVLYDDYDGQNGAMLAWILTYLGHPDVRFLRQPFAEWKGEGRELFYRPVVAAATTFALQPRPELRASWREVAADGPSTLLDVRSGAEYAGRDETTGRRGHIPGAKHIPWLQFVQEGGALFAPSGEIAALLATIGAKADSGIVTYCRTGPRAAVAWLALHELGYHVRLFDGSFAEWARHPDLPVEA